MKKKLKKKGFTILEIIIVIVIVAIIAGIIFIATSESRETARDNQRLNDMRQLHEALGLYKIDEGTYPAAITAGQPLTGSTGTVYMTKVPTNPSPRDDGGCSDSDYIYTQDNSGNSFHVSFCLADATNELIAGNNTVVPDAFLAVDSATCIPNCSGVACGGDDSCGGTCGFCITTPVNYWSFDTNAAATIGGSAYNLDANYSPTHQPAAMENGAYYFYRNPALTCTYNPSFYKIGTMNYNYPNFSISLLAKLNAYDATYGYAAVHNARSGNGGYEHFLVYFYTASGVKTVRAIRRNNNVYKLTDWPFDFQTGTVYHVVATWDGWNVYPKMYIDGVLLTGGTNTSTGTVTAFTGTTYHFNIASFTKTAHCWDGWIDEVMFYNFTMTQEQVTAQYQKFN